MKEGGKAFSVGHESTFQKAAKGTSTIKPCREFK